MVKTPAWLAEIPLVPRWLMIGAILAGSVGAVAGLIVGLYAYAPTAWFAIFELGIPSAFAGAALGALAASVAIVARKVTHS